MQQDNVTVKIKERKINKNTNVIYSVSVFCWSCIDKHMCYVMQAALPQGIVPFVFAKEYNVHPDILSTG